MEWQLIAVLLALAAAVGYLVRASWKTWFGRKAGCGSACGGCAKPVAENVGKRIALPQI